MDRPRRSARQPIKGPTLITPESPVRVIKRKPATTTANTTEIDPEKQLKILLTSSKSDLVSLEMTDIINSRTWAMLSEESRNHLKTLLPPTAFANYQEHLGADHPSLLLLQKEVAETSSKMEVDENERVSKDQMSMPDSNDQTPPQQSQILLPELNHTFFNDSHFLAALRTFQDHLYLNWFTDAHRAKVQEFQEGIQNGTLAAPWKDEGWEKDQASSAGAGKSLEVHTNVSSPGKDIVPNGSGSCVNPNESSARAGGAAEIKLSTIVKKGVIRIGDVIAYRRSFATPLVIEKDCIVESINPKTFALTVLTSPGSSKHLPIHLLGPEGSVTNEANSSSEPSEHPISTTFTSPSSLEAHLLDLDGRLDRTRRPNGNAWKCFSVWRWRSGVGSAGYTPYDPRGGRENHGTLFYLRGSMYHES